MKNSLLLAAIGVLLVGIVTVKVTNFSFTDFIADKVIEKVDAKYSPYGPEVLPPDTEVVPPVVTPPEEKKPEPKLEPKPPERKPRRWRRRPG